MGDIQYQLKFLEKSGLIKSRRIGLYKTYYTVSIFGERDEKILAILQQETPRDVILYLIENPGATQTELVRHKGFTAPTINWHMSRLIEIGLVYSCKEGRFVKYYLEGNVEDIITLLKLYHPSVWNKLSNRLAELFLDIASQSRPDRDSGEKNDVNLPLNRPLFLPDDVVSDCDCIAVFNFLISSRFLLSAFCSTVIRCNISVM